MTRHDRRQQWSISKVEYRGHGPRTAWRAEHRAAWSSYREGGETANVTRKGSVLRCYDRGQERRRHDAAVRKAREALA